MMATTRGRLSVRSRRMSIDDEVLLASLIGPPEASRESLAESKRNVCGPLRPPVMAVEHPHHSFGARARRP
jgi:hypothetical protein